MKKRIILIMIGSVFLFYGCGTIMEPSRKKINLYLERPMKAYIDGKFVGEGCKIILNVSNRSKNSEKTITLMDNDNNYSKIIPILREENPWSLVCDYHFLTIPLKIIDNFTGATTRIAKTQYYIRKNAYMNPLKKGKHYLNINNIAVLLPINNTNDQTTANLLWEKLSNKLYSNKKRGISPKEIKEKLKKQGYLIGDQLLQLDTKKEKKELQEYLGVDGIMFLTINEIHSRYLNEGYLSKTVRIIQGNGILYVDGKKIEKYPVSGISYQEIPEKAMVLYEGTNREIDNQEFLEIVKILNKRKIRNNTTNIFKELTEPINLKMETLYQEKNSEKESPYKKAVNRAVDNFMEIY